MPGWEFATIAIDRTASGGRSSAQWVARSQGEVLASGKRITELVDRLGSDGWEVVDLGGAGARLQRRQDVGHDDLRSSSNSAA